jgi:hypothetical protein
MAVFENREKMHAVLGGLFENLVAHPEFGPKFAATGITIKFDITSPNDQLWITPGDGKKGEVIWGDTDLKATVEMFLSSETCHKFWLRHISMPIALAKGLIKAKGPMPKVLKLLPLLKPAYDMYPEHAKSHGLSIEKE